MTKQNATIMILKEIIESVTKENYFQRDDFEDGTYIWFRLPAENYELVLIGGTEIEETTDYYMSYFGETKGTFRNESDISILRAQIWHDADEIELNLSEEDIKQLDNKVNLFHEWKIEIED